MVVIDREDIGSWLHGPQFSVPEDYWPGKNLGLPESGPGSTAPLWRRLLGLCFDWGMSYVIALFLFAGHELAILAVFAVQHFVLVSTLGTTVGHRVFGIEVRRFDGSAPGFRAGFLRTVLLCLVIPALIFNVDRRGFHDVAGRTVIVRR
ncbi:RDD family protein [Brevibacterium daeguense]|uniref:RDD family protein n=1 Tax=Brevibacterium daeguense TaxID=909936 RepID=A0ABP8ENP8_9MICO